MAYYLKNIYRLYNLGCRTWGSYISIGKSLFVHINGKKIYIIGAKNNETCKIRIVVFKSRNEDDMKTFIYNYIRENNTIITDGWSATIFLMIVITIMKYIFMDLMEIFGFRLHSTSHIEEFGIHSKIKLLKYIIA